MYKVLKKNVKQTKNVKFNKTCTTYQPLFVQTGGSECVGGQWGLKRSETECSVTRLRRTVANIYFDDS